jgi:hypothetical protein
MKCHALELFGSCVSFLSLLARPQSPDKTIEAEFSGTGSSPVDRYESGPGHTPVAEYLGQVGVVVLDYGPNRPDTRASGGRRPPGPVRVIASVG